MKFNTTLIRRTVVSLSAIAALIVTGYAASQTAQTVQLVGSTTNNCVYSSMTVSPNGAVLVQCGGSTSGPGTFTITGPTSLATGSSTTGTAVKVSRSGGSVGAVNVSFTISGACSSTTPSPLAFADGDQVAKGIIVTADVAPGTCSLGITPDGGGTAGGTGSLSIAVVDPNADVKFAMASTTATAQVGPSTTVITATRTGGTNGAWTVPVVLSGDLTSGGLLPSTSGTISAASFSFPANSSTANITYTPPGSMPAGTQLVFTLQNPVAGASPVAGQNGSLGTVTVTTMTLSGPAVGCPAYSGPAPVSLNSQGYVNHMLGTSPYMVAYNLPINTTGFGILGIYSNTTTPTFGPTRTEVKISKCLGDFTDNADGCYQSSGNLINQQFNQEWAPRYTNLYKDQAAFVAKKRCLTAGPGPWYVNIRMSFPTGSCVRLSDPAGKTCGWDPIWKNGSTL